MTETLEGCRICKGSYTEVLDLGNLYPSKFIAGPYDHYYSSKSPGEKAPLTLVQCDACGLVQLKHTVDLDSMYREYWYKSGLNNSMVRDLQDIVDTIQDRVDLYTGDVVIDIGANDGTMLSMFPDRIYKIGVEPAYNMAESLNKVCDFVVGDYFSADAIPTRIQAAKVITAIAMFYDLPDPNKFLQDVSRLLHPTGIFVIQLTDLAGMLTVHAFDNICHEHLEYYSLAVLNKLLKANGLRIFDVEYNTVNGSSIRVFADQGRRPVSDNVHKALEEEAAFLDMYTMDDFRHEVELIREITRQYLRDANSYGEIIYGMGASTKGNTLLQYFGITANDIPCIIEINPEKYGLLTVGSEIPIFPQNFVGDCLEYPDIYFVLPWHFIDNFIEKNQKFLDKGGRFFVPLPWPMEIRKTWEGELKWTYLERPLGN